MATKNNPGQFDCYENAKPDEPMFVLLARDPLAPFMTRIWACVRNGDPLNFIFDELAQAEKSMETKDPLNPKKYAEAIACADNMVAWKRANPDV